MKRLIFWTTAILVTLIALVAFGLGRVLVWAGGDQRSNCLAYALARYWVDGGHIVITRSKWTRVPHVVWTRHFGQFEAFVPIARHQKRTLPPFIFAGRARKSAKP